MQRRSLMANKTFLFYLVALVGFGYVIYLAIESNSKLQIAQERANYAKREYETLSVQVVQLQDQKQKMEKQLQSERNELLKVKSDKDYIEQQRKELFSKLQEFTQNIKTLKAQQTDLQQSLERANRELSDLRAEKDNADQRNQAEFAQLNTQKDLEITKLRDELANLKRRYDEARMNLANVRAPGKAEDAQPVLRGDDDDKTSRRKSQTEAEPNLDAAQNNNDANAPDTPKETKTAKRGSSSKTARQTEVENKDIKASDERNTQTKKDAQVAGNTNLEEDDAGNNKQKHDYQAAQLPLPVPLRENPQSAKQNQLNPPVPVKDEAVKNAAQEQPQLRQPVPPMNQNQPANAGNEGAENNDGDETEKVEPNNNQADQQDRPPVGNVSPKEKADDADAENDQETEAKPDGDEDAENGQKDDADQNEENNADSNPKPDTKREDTVAADTQREDVVQETVNQTGKRGREQRRERARDRRRHVSEH